MAGEPASGRRRRKEAARRLLEPFDLAAVDRFARAEPHAWSALQSLLYDPDALVRWRAIEALGRVAAARAGRDLEGVRDGLRRTLWLMNDESGGLLREGPQVLGAVLAGVPALCDELVELLASFLDEDPFRAGTAWALWRVAAVRPAPVARAAAARLAASLADADPAVRGHAALALSTACGPATTAALAGDAAPLVVFDFRTATLRTTTVRDAARGAP